MKHNFRCNIICSPQDCICRNQEQPKHQPTGGVWKVVAFIAVLLSLAIVLFSCSKTQMVEWNSYDDYSLVVDWRSLDTVRLLDRKRWDYNKMYLPKEKMKFDTAKDMWYIDCNMLNVQQHLYYLKNGKKIQPSRWPKEGEQFFKS